MLHLAVNLGCLLPFAVYFSVHLEPAGVTQEGAKHLVGEHILKENQEGQGGTSLPTKRDGSIFAGFLGFSGLVSYFAVSPLLFRSSE